MSSNINRNALTLEEKVKRKIETSYLNIEDLNEQEKIRFINKLSNIEMLYFISESLEEMFAP